MIILIVCSLLNISKWMYKISYNSPDTEYSKDKSGTGVVPSLDIKFTIKQKLDITL